MTTFVSYQLGADENLLPTVQVDPTPDEFKQARRKPPAKQLSTAFVLVDPSNPASKDGGRAARSSIRKHASRACAGRRLATIAEKKRSQGVLSKKERQQQQSAQRLEAALQEHAKKFDVIKDEENALTIAEPLHEGPPTRELAFQRKLSSSTCSSVASNNSNTNVSGQDWGRAKCSIPWLLARSPSSSASADGLEVVSTIPTMKTSPSRPYDSPAKAMMLQPRQLSLTAYTPLAVDLDETQCSLLHRLFTTTFPLMDLRLPTKSDKVYGRLNTFRKDLPKLVLSSEPLLWSNLLGAGTIDALRLNQSPGESSINLKHRHLAISSVNRRLGLPEDDLVFDVGLMGAIASLGVWERQCGSKDIWRAHCKGVGSLQDRLKESNQDQLVSQIIASCQTLGSECWNDCDCEGFKSMPLGIAFDRGLIAAVCRCQTIEQMTKGTCRSLALQAAAQEILRYSTANAICGRVRYPEGDRLCLLVHVLVQGAAVSMINFLAADETVTNVNEIDLPRMCIEAVELARSVLVNPIFEEMLLWALFTMYSLNKHGRIAGIALISRILCRLKILDWPSLVVVLGRFVYLDSATAAYQRFWSIVKQHEYASNHERG